jgi:lipopolysaccharide heptosyltransferase II
MMYLIILAAGVQRLFSENYLYKFRTLEYNAQPMEIKKVLFFKPGAIGDLLQALPALKALKQKFPAAHITVMVSPGLASLLQGTPVADRVQVFDKEKLKKRLKDFIDFVVQLRAERYDVFIDMQTSTRSLVLRRLSGAGLVLVYRKQRKYGRTGPRLHAAENFMETLLPLGIIDPVTSIELPLKPDAVKAVDRFLSDCGVDKTKPLIALNCNVGEARPARNWFPERFAALADRLVKELGARVIFVGGGQDRELVRSVTAAMHEKAVSAAGVLSLEHSAALLARCSCLVSSDTGPLHLATAVQTPVVGLYGSTDPRRTGPIGRRNRVLIKDLSCVPCEEKNCPLGSRACMQDITVDEVCEAVRKALA